MTKHLRYGAVLAALSLLALGTACSSHTTAKAATAAPTATAVAAQPAVAQPAAAAQATTAPPDKGSADGPTAGQLADYQKMVQCLRGHGVKMADPKVGQPFDITPMNDLFDKDQNKFNAVVDACPAYQKLIAGVG